MIELTPSTIALHTRARTKEDAIRAAGRVLVESGHIAPGYVESMLGRERQANTYLAHGIAIPHGLQGDRGLIHRTGVSVVQVRSGVEWSRGQTVHLVIGIAAKSDEHLAILSALTDVLDEPNTARRLAETDDPREIIDSLSGAHSGARTAPSAATSEPLAGARTIEVALPPGSGLHARPASAFVAVAQTFAAEVRVSYRDRTANGKAMAALLKLGAEGGAQLRVEARGPDAEPALQALARALSRGVEDEEPAKIEGARPAAFVPPEAVGQVVIAVAAAPGLAIAPIFRAETRRITVADRASEPALERAAWVAALAAARVQLDASHEALRVRVGAAQAAIFSAQRALLDDPELLAEIDLQLDAGHAAGWSVEQVIERRAEELSALDDPRLAARSADLRDIGQRLLGLLTGASAALPSYPDEPFILVADDLAPSDTVRLDRRRVLGLCTAAGAPTSHTAILARTLELPAIVSAGEAVLALRSGTHCILDGDSGKLYVEPSAKVVEAAEAHRRALESVRQHDQLARFEPALLRDGHRIEVVANIGKASDAARAVEAGAEGVGLMRSEFLFLDRSSPPSEQEQFEAYAEMADALHGLPLIIRTLDIGGDKVLPYLPLPHEENPFLGVRGIRLCLRRPELFLPQLRAIYRASLVGPIKIMFPMVATLEELRAATAAAEQVRSELGVPKLELGIMVEVPSVVMMADAFAREVDFFSIGTNDLTQYALAMDRMHPELAREADSLHPAVLRMVDMTVKAAVREGRWVGVCGALAGDPLGAAILSGLGVAELSASMTSIAAVKAHLRRFTRGQLETLAQRALRCTTAQQVRELERP